MSFYSGYISRASSFLRLFRELKQGKHSCRHFLWRNYTQANIETKDKLAETCCLWKFVVQCIKIKRKIINIFVSREFRAYLLRKSNFWSKRTVFIL